MPEKILYILGAGASVNAMPLAKSVYSKIKSNPPKIKGLIYELENFDWGAIPGPLSQEEFDIVNSVNQEFKELAKQAQKFGDVDTYAKYFHLLYPGSPHLRSIKRTLSLFFGIKQKLANQRDQRYLPWLVSIMDKQTFPKSVKILNWNYDYQVQLASAELGGGIEDITHNSSGFSHSPSLMSYLPTLDTTFNDHNNLSLIHLNGIAGFVEGGALKTGSIYQKKYQRLSDLNDVLIKAADSVPQFHFAWERGPYHIKLMNHVKSIIQETTVLVVIGYSFPFFNREIDKQIFEKLKQNSFLKKIYYQDPILNGQQLKSQFGLEPNFDIVHIRQTDNFHIPFEY